MPFGAEDAAEQAYRECDPLNMDAALPEDPYNYEGTQRLIDSLADFTRRSAFYLEAVEKAMVDTFRGARFGNLLTGIDVKIRTACKLMQEGMIDAAEFVLKDAIEDYEMMEERISDWATD